jgi:hypothetical protein
VPITHTDLCRCAWHRAPFSGDGWFFELKHDGFRALAHSGTRVQLKYLLTLNGVDLRGRPNSAWLKIKNRAYSRRGALEYHG